MKSLIAILFFTIPCLFFSCNKEPLMGEVAGIINYAGTLIPVPDVTVTIDASVAVSDAAGFYSVRNAVGKYYLNAEREGFDLFSEEVKIFRGKLDLDIEMTSSEYTGLVHGVVRGNHTGHIMPGMRVLMLNPDETESEIHSFSDRDGFYSLQGVPYGERMIIVVEDGIIVFQELVLVEESAVELNIYLPESFEFVDQRDGNVYQALKIGTQTWMTKNLAWLPEVTGPANGSYEEPKYYVFGNLGSNLEEVRSSANYAKYGALYNWSAAKISCPAGWHLPSDDEWQTLEAFLGMGNFDVISDGARRAGEVGYKLKSESGWINNGNGDNSSRFNVLPVGVRFDSGSFDMYGLRSVMWTSTKSSDSYAWGRGLGTTVNWVDRARHDIQNGLTVRCISGNSMR